MGNVRERQRQDEVLARMPQARRDEVWALSLEERMARLVFEVAQHKEWKRRRFLGAAVGAATAIYLAANGLIAIDQKTRNPQEREQQYAPTRLEVLNDCKEWYPPRDGGQWPDESFITVGGLGCVSSEPHAYPMAIDGLNVKEERTTPMIFLVSSLAGKTIPEVAELLQREAEHGGSLSFYGQSNGSVVILEALSYLKEKKDIIIPVNRFVLNCSPFDFSDAMVTHIEEWLGKFLVNTSYEPGMIGQFLYLLRDNWTIEREQLFYDLLETVRKSWNRTKEGEPPDPWIADLRILIGSRLEERNLTGIVTKDTEILIVKSQNDNVVFNDQSVPKYVDKFLRHTKKVKVVTMDQGIGHADSRAGSRMARPWLEETDRHRDRGRRGAVDS